MTEHGCSKCVWYSWDHRDHGAWALLCVFYCLPRAVWHYYRCPGR